MVIDNEARAFLTELFDSKLKNLDDRLSAHGREHELLQMAIDKAEADVNKRVLTAMEGPEKRFEQIGEDMGTIKSQLSNLEGRIWGAGAALGVVITGLNVAINIFSR